MGDHHRAGEGSTTVLALPPGIELTTLPSGVRVATEAMPDVRSVSVGYWVGVGSRDEHHPQIGASHFLEHLLFKGTEQRTALEIAELLDEVGGDMNAFTSKEHTCFHARCLDRDLARATDVLGDMITSSLITPDDVESERDVVLEEIRMHLDTPDDLVHSDFAEGFHGDHPLGREILGSDVTIAEMSRDDVAGYYHRHYAARNLVVAVAGNVEHDATAALVAEALDGIAEGVEQAERRTPPTAGPARPVTVRQRPTEQVQIVLGGRGMERGHPLRYAASVLNQALGAGMASRLFQEVRERRGLAYSVYSYPSMHTDTGTFAVYAGTAPANTEKVLEVVRAEMTKVLTDGLTEAEFARARGHLTGSVMLALEDTSSRMSRLGKSLISDVPLQSLDEVLAAIEDVSRDDVEAVTELFLAGPFTLSLVGPLEDGSADAYAAWAEPLR